MDTQLMLTLIGVSLNVVQTITVALAAFFAVGQLRENTRVRQADVMAKVFEYVSFPEVRAARKRVRGMVLPSDLSQLSTEEINDIELALSGWARVGALFELDLFGLKDKDKLFQTYSLSINSSWTNLKRYVAYERQKTGMPDYWRNVEILAEQATAWRKGKDLPTWPQQSSAPAQAQ